MSLRVFHIVFISASVLLSEWVAVWAIVEFSRGRNPGWIVLAALFAACGFVLIAYGRKTFRKLKELG